MESEDSFEYEEESDISFEEDESVVSFSRQEDDASVTSADDLYHQHDGDLKKSTNFLSHSLYRPFLLRWYIKEHFLLPCKNAKRTILPDFSEQELMVMLHHKKWLVNETADDYYNHWPKLRDACGLTEKRGETHDITEEKNFTCYICCETGNLTTFGLPCGHKFCVDCYSQYINSSLGRGNLIRCLDLNCNLSLYHEDIDKINAACEEKNEVVPEPQLVPEEPESDPSDSDDDEEKEEKAEDEEYDKHFHNMDLLLRMMQLEDDHDPLLDNPLLQSTAKTQIDGSKKKYKWCPAVDCTNFVELSVDDRPDGYSRHESSQLSCLPMVRCPAAHEFCFDCQYENHLPCPCFLVEKWLKRCRDDSETANWIDANTQPCPKCFLSIEKNGGCNHMTCQTCGYEFCWICLGVWNIHGTANYECNRYDQEEVNATKKKRSEKQDALSRYLHFYRRFSIHQQSMAGDERTLANVHKYMLLYMKTQRSTENTSSWNDVQFMSDAIRSLSSGRKTLMWTYAFSFYMAKSNFADMFAGMQDYLTKTVEDLSGLFEDVNKGDMTSKKKEAVMLKLTRKKSAIVSLSALVSKRQRLLIEYVASCLDLNSLKFNDL